MTFILMIAALVLLAVDWLQTITICRMPGKREVWIEKIIGEHPKERRVHYWFAACAAALVAYAVLAPSPWQLGLLLPILAQVAAVVRNHRLGIRPASISSL